MSLLPELVDGRSPPTQRADRCRPHFGASTTLRGIVLAIPATGLAAPLIGLLTGGLAMAGDLLSSFIKRRLALPPSSRALGLDQIPESLLPLIAGRSALGTVLFVVGEILLSHWLYRPHIRDQPHWATALRRRRCSVISGPVRVVDAVVVAGIVDASEMNRLIAALDHLRLVQQHADAPGLQARHHSNGIVVADDPVDGRVRIHLPVVVSSGDNGLAERPLQRPP